MKIIAIIPARMGSSRFPGKPLAKINNRPMIEHVFNNVRKSRLISEVIVATCDREIFKCITDLNGKAVMTSKKHKRASDRCYEALKILEKKSRTKFDIVVMVQGDEPMINAKMIDVAVKPMIKNKKINVINLVRKIDNRDDFNNPNFIKVVHDNKNNALYFSRSPIPNIKFKKNKNIKNQVCVIPFRRDFLIRYSNMNPSPLEKIESIDMLRVLENGYQVFLVETGFFSHAVDTKKDLKKVEKYLKR